MDAQIREMVYKGKTNLNCNEQNGLTHIKSTQHSNGDEDVSALSNMKSSNGD